MGFFDHLKIATKILTALVMLAIVAAICVAIGSVQMVGLTAEMDRLTQHNDTAMVQLARANRELSLMGYEAYRTIAYPGESREAKDAGIEGRAAIVEADKLLAKAATLLPEKAAKIEQLRAEVTKVAAIVESALTHGLKNENAAATADMAQADPAILATTQAIAALANTIVAETADLSVKAANDSSAAIRLMILSGLAGIAAALGYGLWVSSRKVSRPLTELAATMNSLATGALDVFVEGQGRGDEVGTMAKAVQVFKDNGVRLKASEAEAESNRQHAEEQRHINEIAQARAAREQAVVVEQIAAGLARLSSGDLTYRVTETFAQDYKKLQDDFNAAVETLQNTMKIIAGNTSGIKSGSSEITQASDDLSRRTEQQAASLEETAAALNEITATVKSTAEGAIQAREVVAAAKADAEQGGEVVGKAITAMSEIAASAQKISQIIGVIDEIAFQTNLLALNAGVEAARAGDAGRGFAVVASEVRALAQRSAEAAKEIKTLIMASTSQVNSGVELVGQTGTSLERILSQITQINSVVATIAASAQEQATGLHQVNTAVNQMDQVTQQNAAMVEESTAASHALAQEADDLARLMGQFQVGESAFAERRPAAAPARRPAAPNPGRRPASVSGAATARKLAVAESAMQWDEF